MQSAAVRPLCNFSAALPCDFYVVLLSGGVHQCPRNRSRDLQPCSYYPPVLLQLTGRGRQRNCNAFSMSIRVLNCPQMTGVAGIFKFSLLSENEKLTMVGSGQLMHIKGLYETLSNALIRNQQVRGSNPLVGSMFKLLKMRRLRNAIHSRCLSVCQLSGIMVPLKRSDSLKNGYAIRGG